MRFTNTLFVLLAAITVGCGNSSGGGPVTVGDDDDLPLDLGNGAQAPAPYRGITWNIQPIETGTVDNPAGDLGKLAVAADGTMYYAYMRKEPSTSSDCVNLGVFSDTDAVPGVRYQIHVAVRPAGGTFGSTIERIPVENVGGGAPNFIGGRYGLDAAVNPANNQLLIATPGGGNGTFTCASSDLVIARRTGANAYTLSTPVTDSSSCCAPCPMDQVGQDACLRGSDAGYYPTIGIRNSGGIAVAYQDMHFVTDNDGKSHSDFELVDINGGATAFTPIDIWSGNGYWGTLRFKGNDGYASGSNVSSGVPQLYQSIGDAVWEPVPNLTFDDKAQGRVQLEIAPDGTIGLAYYQVNDSFGATTNDLRYCELFDGEENWTCDEPESAVLVAGASPSLTYNADSQPVLSYHYCGSGSCVHDGLRMAWRDNNGRWWTFNVHNVDNNRSGFWSSVQIDPATQQPIIVFQDLTRGAAMVAYGQFVP